MHGFDVRIRGLHGREIRKVYAESDRETTAVAWATVAAVSLVSALRCHAMQRTAGFPPRMAAPVTGGQTAAVRMSRRLARFCPPDANCLDSSHLQP